MKLQSKKNIESAAGLLAIILAEETDVKKIKQLLLDFAEGVEINCND